MTPEGSEPEPVPEPESTELEDALCRWLSAFDEHLAGGASVATPDPIGAPAALLDRLGREAAWCRKVRGLWSQVVPDEPETDTASYGRPGGPRGPEPRPIGVGRFVVRDEIGRGTFGVVYLAYDPRLHREVALKLPRAEAVAMPELRERFRNEATAAAGLDHPNIVPVYEAGEDDSVCYIASAYCPGITLAAWLRGRRRPVPFRLAADLAATLAEAVEHAHRRGVLHRDLKPSNVLLEIPDSPPRDDDGSVGGEFPGDGDGEGDGSRLVPRVTDFGLAKLMDAGPDAAGLTMSGVIMGTPSYMAPEQAEGRAGRVGPAVDIYGLGAILYEVLTGRPPFQGDSSLETLVLVRSRDPLPPSRLRPRVPRDLETICLKCLHKSPSARYASARALADDLRRFLAAEPILARPTPRWERALKWTRRHPAVAAMAGSGAIAAVALAAAIGLANVRLQRERDVAEARRLEAVANLRKAREAVDRMLTRVGEERLKDIPQVEPVQRALLEDALEFYRDFARQARGDPEVLVETSRAFRRLGGSYSWLGRNAEAEGCHREAIAIEQGLAADFPAVAVYRHELARTYLDLSRLWRVSDRTADGKDAARTALTLFEGLASADPAEPAYREGEAEALNLHAMLLEDLHEDRAAEADYRQSLARFGELSGRFPAVGRYRTRAAMVGNNLAALFEAEGRGLDEAERLYRHNLAFWKGMAADEPAIPDHRSKLALTSDNLAGVLAKTGRKPEAEQYLRSAVDLRSALTRDFPNSPHHFTKLAEALNGLATLAADRGDLGEARRLREQAIVSRRTVVALAPGNAGYRRWLADAHAALVETLIRSGEHAAASRSVAEWIAMSADSAPDRFRAGAFLARCVPLATADARLADDRRAALAGDYAGRAIDLIRESLRRGHPGLEALKTDRSFDPLRSRDDFRALIAEATATAPAPPAR